MGYIGAGIIGAGLYLIAVIVVKNIGVEKFMKWVNK